MPLKTTPAGETTGMELISGKLGRHGPLARFIAKRRTPGPDWLPYEEIAGEIRTLTRRTVTRAGVEKWAKTYGIPKTYRKATKEELAEYLVAVEKYLKRRPGVPAPDELLRKAKGLGDPYR